MAKSLLQSSQDLESPGGVVWTERGQLLPPYRELAGVLEPWLYHEARGRNLDFTLKDVRHWERRVLG